MYDIQIDNNSIILLINIDINIVRIALKKDIVLKVQDSFFLSQVLKNEKHFAKWKKKENTSWAEGLEYVNSNGINNGHKNNSKHTVLTKNCFKSFLYVI